MGQLDEETAILPAPTGEGFTTRLSDGWSIGTNPNGGYAVQPVLQALTQVAGQPDPTSITVHYLRPALGDADGAVRASVVRSGRRSTFATGALVQAGQERLTASAVLADLSVPASDAPDPRLTVPRPSIPPPERCVDRRELGQGVDLPLMSRVDVRVSRETGNGRAVVEGWIRLRDGTAPSPAALVLFADAFPPAVHAVVERVGWVPTLELTVHVRRRPQPGWVQARMECDDVAGGWMLETGSLWDETGVLVARSRQLGMLLSSP